VRAPLPVPARAVRTETVVERSRFLATLEPVDDEAGLDALAARVRREFPDAGHHCTASVLGADGERHRSSDDGEPAGTAGAPMLAALRGAGLTGIAVVVTRWFGGTLLGTGGLVRAYGGAVSGALARAGVVHRRLVDLVEVRTGPGEGGRVEAQLRREHRLEDVAWTGSGWRAVVPVPAGEVEAFRARLAAAGLDVPAVVLTRALRPL
jgi:uncharacterized YigZ family protein